jgi:hypothetical protein
MWESVFNGSEQGKPFFAETFFVFKRTGFIITKMNNNLIKLQICSNLFLFKSFHIR